MLSQFKSLLRLDDTIDSKKGFSKSEMESLITFEYKTKSSNETSDNSQICPICLENFVIKDKIVILNCMHKFHINCIKPWFIVSK